MAISVQLRKYNLDQLSNQQKSEIMQAGWDRMHAILSVLPPEVVSALGDNAVAACRVYTDCCLKNAVLGKDEIAMPNSDQNNKALQGSAATIFERLDADIAADLLRSLRQTVDEAFTAVLGPPPAKTLPGR